MSHHFRNVSDAAVFRLDRMSKTDLFSGGQLFVGLNCFEPGQSQASHVHRGADKFYFLVSGKARMIVGEETWEAVAGDLVWAPADRPHGVADVLERTVMLVAMAPPSAGAPIR